MKGLKVWIETLIFKYVYDCPCTTSVYHIGKSFWEVETSCLLMESENVEHDEQNIQ